MYKVEKTAETLFEGVNNMTDGAKEDYIKWSTMGGKELSGYCKEQVDAWDDKIKVKAGQKYIKIVRDNSVFAFVNINNPKFKKGDIFKPAGYNKPALNQARGNVLEGNYAIQWTGPLYLK